MQIQASLLESIPQTRYLSAENYSRYRAIMRLFYDAHMKLCYQLDKEVILEKLRENPVFAQYDYTELIADLNQLTMWKNLTPIQDPHKTYTVADFKNRQFQYMMSRSALEIERMTIALETLSIQTTALSSSAFHRIYEALGRLPSLEKEQQKDVEIWWRDLTHDFHRLSQSYQDYLREFYGPSAEKQMKSADFISHKQQLVHYLEEFIQELQSSSAQISVRLEDASQEQVERVFALVDKSALSVPRPQVEQTPGWEAALCAQNRGVWQSLTDWFVGKSSVVNQVLEVTNEVIRRIVQNAALLVQMQNFGVSNKAELRSFLSLFASCDKVEEAHRLASQLFGAQCARHYAVNAARETERIDSGTYDEPPLEYLLHPRTRAYRPRLDKSGFQDKSGEKELLRREILAQQQKLKQEVLSYIEDGILDLSRVERPISPQVRTVFLAWVAVANLNPDKRGRTEYGQTYTLQQNGNAVCHLPCTDGTLTLPSCKLLFEEGSS